LSADQLALSVQHPTGLASSAPRVSCLQEKASYREAYGQLKGVKAEIDGVQASLEHARARLQHDFQAWYAAMAASTGGGAGVDGGAPGMQGVGQAAASAAMPGGWGMQQQQQVQQPVQPEKSGQQQVQPEQQGWTIPAAGAQQLQVRSSSMGGSWASPAGAGGQPGPTPAAGMSAAPPFNDSWGQGLSAQQQPQQPQSQQFSRPAAASTAFTSSTGAWVGPGAQPPPPQQHQAFGAGMFQQQQQPQQQPPHQRAQQQALPEEPADPYSGVDAEVLAAAKPLLTGNPEADADIIKFYQARAALLKGMQ